VQPRSAHVRRYRLPSAWVSMTFMARYRRKTGRPRDIRLDGVPWVGIGTPPIRGPGTLSSRRHRGQTGRVIWKRSLIALPRALAFFGLLLPAVLTGLGVVVFLQPMLSDRPPVMFAVGLAFVALGMLAAPWTLRGYAGLAQLVLAPSEEAKLELRVRHLAQTRRETLDTGAAELRRIERDLHDGAQARLVAMGLTLDAAGRLIDTDPAAARGSRADGRRPLQHGDRRPPRRHRARDR
jgi:Histidine kinase